MSRHVSYSRVPLLVAATACWGTGTVVTKQVLGSVQPLTLLPLQLGASCLFLLTAVLISNTRLAWSPQMTRLTVLGILNPGVAYALGLLGLASITASTSVLLWAAEPVLILLLAAAVLREHVPLALAAAVAVAVLGVVLVVYQPGATGDAVGVALTVAAVGACALYTVLTRRLLIDDASLPVVLVQQAAALGFAVALAVIVLGAGGQGWSTATMTPLAWVGAAASGILYYGAAFWFFLAGLRQVPASVAGAFLPLIPVFGVAVAYLTGERLDPRQWLGAALVVGATVVVTTRQVAGKEEKATSL
jgi:drug/metabolite transporter (DMT)-like permease